MALTVIPLHLNETIRQYIYPDRDVEDIPETPFIKVYGDIEDSDRFEIIADNELVCTCRNLISAVGSLVATFYIFNIAYPKELVATLTFIQKFIIGMQDGVKKNSKVIGFISKVLK